MPLIEGRIRIQFPGELLWIGFAYAPIPVSQDTLYTYCQVEKNGLKEYHTFPIINQFKICSGLSENTSTTDDSKDYIISLTVSAEFETSLTLPKITAFSTLVIYRYKFAIFVW